MGKKTIYNNFFGWAFGTIVIALGLMNISRGNDFGFGVFLIILSLIYFPPSSKLLTKKLGISIHYLVKIGLAIFIIWAILAVGAIAEGYYPELYN
ncbi:hypothetical protein ACV07N_11265 [Roseivirga echinicomitans]